MPVLDRVNHWASVQPEARAVVVGSDSLTYGELQARATEILAATATEHQTGHLTVLCQANGVDFAVRFIAAVAGTGRCAVLDPEWPVAVRDEIVERLCARENDEQQEQTPDYRMLDRQAPTRLLDDGPASSVFLYGLTSGTTSIPKCFTRTRASWQLACAASTDYFAVTKSERTLVTGPLSASLSLYALTESLYAGAAIHALPVFDVGSALESIVQHQITRIVAVPAALRLIAERGRAAGIDALSITSIVSAGAALDARTLAAIRAWAPAATVYQYYGAAELNFVAAARLRDAGDGGDAVGSERIALGDPPAGTAFPGVEIKIGRAHV